MDRLSILHLFLWKSNLQMILCQIIFPRVWLIGWLCPPFLSWCCFHSSKYICRYLDVPFKELFFKKQHGAGLEFLPPAAGGISLSIQPKGQQRLSFSPHKKSVVLCLLIPTNSLPIARSAQEAIPPPNDLAKFVSVWCFWKRPINSSNSLRSLAWVDFQYRRFAVNSLNKSSMTLSDSLLFFVFLTCVMVDFLYPLALSPQSLSSAFAALAPRIQIHRSSHITKPGDPELDAPWYSSCTSSWSA